MEEETGERTMIRCCLPNGHLHPTEINLLERALAIRFGGFTRYLMLGAWFDLNSQEIQKEEGCIYEVSFKPAEASTATARRIFTTAGRNMGERWVHIEHHTFQALHTRVN